MIKLLLQENIFNISKGAFVSEGLGLTPISAIMAMSLIFPEFFSNPFPKQSHSLLSYKFVKMLLLVLLVRLL